MDRERVVPLYRKSLLFLDPESWHSPHAEQVIYIFTAAIFSEGLILAQGWIGAQWVWGTTLYLTTLLTVLGKAALISESVISSLSPDRTAPLT